MTREQRAEELLREILKEDDKLGYPWETGTGLSDGLKQIIYAFLDETVIS